MKQFLAALLAVTFWFSAPGIVTFAQADPAAELAAQLETARNNAFSCAEWAENKYCRLAQTASGEVRQRFEQVRSAYHADTNSYLNRNISKISGTTGKDNAERERKAAETNLWKTYHETKISFYQYHAALTYLAARATSEVPVALRGTDSSVVLNSVSFVQEEILSEMDRAQLALTIALENYAQMRILYPLHAQLESLIEDLNKLRSGWEKFMDQIARMPRKLINLSKKSS